MKKTLSILILFTISINVYSLEKDKIETVPPYSIRSVTKNTNLKSDESEIIITWNNVNSHQKKPNKMVEVIYSINSISSAIKVNPNINFTTLLKPDKYIFQFYIESHIEIYTDSIDFLAGHSTHIDLNFQYTRIPAMAEKPVIYVYSPSNQSVFLNLNMDGKIIFSYPNYTDGWRILTDTSGGIYCNNKKYNYLFYDAYISILNSDINQTSGFIVEKNQLLTFLENSLEKMNFSSQEQQDFITYWYPKMIKNESNFIRFLFNEEYDRYISLNVDPKPDHLFRVYMLWSDAASLNNQVQAQELPQLVRNGYFILEWGGSEIKINEN